MIKEILIFAAALLIYVIGYDCIAKGGNPVKALRGRLLQAVTSHLFERFFVIVIVAAIIYLIYVVIWG